MELKEALIQILDACTEAELSFGLAGGFAFALYCEPRATASLTQRFGLGS